MDTRGAGLSKYFAHVPNIPHLPFQSHATEKFLLTHMFALIIGINDYQYIDGLDGAVPDADAIYAFLTTHLQVPHGNIVRLLDGDATRAAIIREIEALAMNSSIPTTGAALLIYFSGHGARSPVPDDWAATGYQAANSQVEMLCPVDLFASYNGVTTTGIPDRVLNCLLHELSDAKGNNITVILDCCHSAGMARSLPMYMKKRGIANPVPIAPGLDNHILSRNGPVSAGENQSAYILLAAAARDQEAQEFGGRGLFTTALLEVMRGSNIDELTYSTLMAKAALIRVTDSQTLANIQTPHHEGLNIHRCLFHSEAQERFISGRFNRVRVDVGLAQGVTSQSTFAIFMDNTTSTAYLTQPFLSIDTLKHSHTILTLPQGFPPIHPQCHAKHVLPETLLCLENYRSKERVERVMVNVGSVKGIAPGSIFTIFENHVTPSVKKYRGSPLTVEALEENHTILAVPPDIPSIPTRCHVKHIRPEQIPVYFKNHGLEERFERVRVDVGSAQGVTSESTFAIFANDTASKTNHQLGSPLAVDSVEMNHSILALPEGPTNIPSHFFARMVPPEKIKVYFESHNLASILEVDVPVGWLFVQHVQTTEAADVCVSSQDNQIIFRWAQNNVLNTHCSPRNHLAISVEETNKVLLVLRAFARFKYHLWRESDELGDDQVSMELKTLRGALRRRPDGENLLEEGRSVSIVNGSSGPICVTVYNRTDCPLYLSLFYFGSQLNIVHLFLPALAPQGERADRSVLPDSSFCVGQGDGGQPFFFSLPEGCDVDVGFLKLFFDYCSNGLHFATPGLPLRSSQTVTKRDDGTLH